MWPFNRRVIFGLKAPFISVQHTLHSQSNNFVTEMTDYDCYQVHINLIHNYRGIFLCGKIYKLLQRLSVITLTQRNLYILLSNC